MKVPKTFIPDKKKAEDESKSFLDCLENKLVFPKKGIVKDDDLRRMFTPEVLDDILHNCYRDDMKKAAEISYALAMQFKDEGNVDLKNVYGDYSFMLYEKFDVRSLEDAAPFYYKINGVILPDIMHEKVVEEKLGLSKA